MEIKPINIINEINRCKIVSFDVFDTLITRKLIVPRDVHFYVGVKANQKFDIGLTPFLYMQLRIQAEKIARENSDKEDIELDDIYTVLQTLLLVDDNTLTGIKNLELEAELNFTTPRNSMKKIYDYAIAHKKKVYFVSDMYLPQAFIIKLLRKNGYDATEKNTLVSSNQGVIKFTGNLFNKLIEVAAPKSNTDIIHIGDNFNVDIKPARAQGLRAYYSENVHETFLSIPAIKVLFNKNTKGSEINLGLSLALGIMANKLLDDIHSKNLFDNSSLFNGSTYNLGYMGLGIFLINFVDWLVNYAENKGLKQLAFLARDGHIIKEIYDIVARDNTKLPKSIYLYSSRRMFSIPSFKIPQDLNIIFNNFYEGTVESFVTNRLGLDFNKDIQNILLKELNLKPIDTITTSSITSRKLVNILKDKILQNAENERKNLLSYFNEVLDLNQPIGMVDLGYNGSIVRYFNKLTNLNVPSINIASDCTAYEKYGYPYNQEIVGYISDMIPFVNYNYNLRTIIPMLESCFSTLDNQAESVRFIAGKHVIKFIDDAQSQDLKRVNFINDLKAGILDFAKEYIRERNVDPKIFVTNAIDASKFLTLHFNEPSAKDLEIWDGIYFENNFAGWKNKAIFSTTDKFISLWGVNTNPSQNETLKTRNASSEYDIISSFSTKEKLVFAFYGLKKAKKLGSSCILMGKNT